MAADGVRPRPGSDPRQRPRHIGTVFAVLSLGVISFGVLQSMLGPALTLIGEHLHTSQSSIAWVMTAYMISASIATPILGRLGDMFGKKRVLLVALLAPCLGSLVGALADTLSVMIVARAIQGLGGGVLPLAFSIIRDEFPAARVASAIGAIAAMVAAGVGVGTVMSGVITDSLGYRWLFWSPMVVMAVAVVVTFFLVPESPVRRPGRVNLVGAALLSAWLVALLVPVSNGERWGWTSGRVVAPIGLAGLLFVAWIVAEWRSDDPLVDMHMMRERPVWTTNLAALAFGFVMAAYMTYLPLFVQASPDAAGYGFDATVTEAGLFLLPGTVASFLVGPVAGWMTSRIGGKVVVAFGAIVLTASTTFFALLHDAGWAVYVVSVMTGAGIGIGFSAMSALVVTAVRPEQVGVATGMNANLRTIGGAIGIAIVTAIVSADVVSDGTPVESGYTNGFWLLSAAGLLALLAALLVRTEPTPAEGVPESGETAPIGALQAEPTR